LTSKNGSLFLFFSPLPSRPSYPNALLAITKEGKLIRIILPFLLSVFDYEEFFSYLSSPPSQLFSRVRLFFSLARPVGRGLDFGCSTLPSPTHKRQSLSRLVLFPPFPGLENRLFPLWAPVGDCEPLTSVLRWSCFFFVGSVRSKKIPCVLSFLPFPLATLSTFQKNLSPKHMSRMLPFFFFRDTMTGKRKKFHFPAHFLPSSFCPEFCPPPHLFEAINITSGDPPARASLQQIFLLLPPPFMGLCRILPSSKH